ncbi:MAG TPA: sulfite exporter TauE/SafE family protein [Nocardioides sp.]|uniref:sulfite exporter TauE/SafE family protein n=1 Tax=Nocardioides sp. TaxID=35761 RepID=UPI002F3F7309
MTDLAWPVVVAIGLVVTLGAYVQAVVGLGIGLLGAPVVALVDPSLVPDLTLWLALLISGLNLLGEHEHVDWRSTAWSLPARVPGTVVGAWLVAVFSEKQIGVVLAAMVLAAVALSLRALEVPVNAATLATAGFVAGATGTATSIGGPPIALLYQRREPHVARATMSVFFFVGVVLSLGGLAIAGALDREPSVLALLMAPGVVLAYVVGRHTRNVIDRETFRRGVLVVCAFSALVLLVRSVA